MKKDTILSNIVSATGDLKIQKNDILSIQVSSLNSGDDALFNSSGNSSSTSSLSKLSAISSGSGGDESLAGSSSVIESPSNGGTISYQVDSSGNIQMHKLGLVHVEGMTLKDLKNMLEKNLQPYLKDPIVSTDFANHRVTILGNVKSPGILTIPKEGLTILNALAMSGDIGGGSGLILGNNVEDIIVIRDSLNNKQLKHVNLEDGSIFKSQWYYLQANDIVYVKTDFEKQNRDESRTKTYQTVSILATSLSLLILILSKL